MGPGACRRVGCAIAIAVAIAHRAALAGAEEPSPAGRIDIYVVGSGAPVSRLESALGAVDRPMRWFEMDTMDFAEVTRAGAAASPTGAPGDAIAPTGARGVEARVWVDCSSPDRVRLYFADGSAERFLLREVPMRDGYTALSLETIAQMIESALSTLLAAREGALTRAEMSAALGTQRAPPGEAQRDRPARSAIDASLGAFYAAQAFAGDWPVEHGPGISASVDRRQGSLRPGAWLTGQYQVPETIDHSLAGVHIDTFALRAGAELGMPVSADATLAVRIGAGGDVLHVTPRQGTGAIAALAEPRFYWDWMAQLALVGNLRCARELFLFGAILVDVDLVLRHYDVEVDAATIRFLTPWRARPGIMAGLAWH